MKNVITRLYPFNELSDEAKQRAINDRMGEHEAFHYEHEGTCEEELALFLNDEASGEYERFTPDGADFISELAIEQHLNVKLWDLYQSLSQEITDNEGDYTKFLKSKLNPRTQQAVDEVVAYIKLNY